MGALKLRKIGSSVGVILPKEMLERLNLREGDNCMPTKIAMACSLVPKTRNSRQPWRPLAGLAGNIATHSMNWLNNAGLDTGSGDSRHARGIAARAWRPRRGG